MASLPGGLFESPDNGTFRFTSLGKSFGINIGAGRFGELMDAPRFRHPPTRLFAAVRALSINGAGHKTKSSIARAVKVTTARRSRSGTGSTVSAGSSKY